MGSGLTDVSEVLDEVSLAGELGLQLMCLVELPDCSLLTYHGGDGVLHLDTDTQLGC